MERWKREQEDNEWGLMEEWGKQSPRGRKAKKRLDYSNVKETDEVGALTTYIIIIYNIFFAWLFIC